MPETTTLRAPLLMMASMLSFALGDTFVKVTGGTMPVSQLLVLRGILATAFIAALAFGMGHLRLRLPGRDWGLIGLRSVAEAASAYFFITALFYMPLANASAILQLLPLTITLGSFLFLGEAVGWRRWVAVGAGFFGMLLIVRPGTEGFNLYSSYALAAVVFVTLRDLTTRRMSEAVPSLMVTLAAAITVLLFASLLSLGQDWVPMTGRLWLLVLGASVFVIFGYSFSVLVMRAGEASLTAPFRYSGLVFSLLLGLLVFGHWPESLTLVGAAIVVASGGFTMWREKKRAADGDLPIASAARGPQTPKDGTRP